MAFVPLRPVVEKSVSLIPIIGPGMKYAKTAQKVTKFSNPVKATTYTAGILLELCGGKYVKYSVLCAVWATSTAAGAVTGNLALLALGLEAGNEILEDFYG